MSKRTIWRVTTSARVMFDTGPWYLTGSEERLREFSAFKRPDLLTSVTVESLPLSSLPNGYWTRNVDERPAHDGDRITP